MVIQIIPKDQEKSSLANILLYLSLILLAALATSYFVLNNIQKTTEKDVASLDAQLAVAGSSDQASMEREVLNYQQKINDFSDHT